ncbi:MAG TPA: toll/interleukin-1 receptor domain-containing protein [Chthoniobacteraceae bacterium]|nr:toll/interleukin-1 receptor domain-containing protein [Chthoniobacteraceae bacterium]
MAQFDVFVSYAHRDKAWVEQTLIPRLREAELNICQDVAQFRAGASCIANMEAAVAGCRRTLAVLTPAWVASDWCNLEGHLTLLEDPVGRRRRLVPILLEPCTPSASVRLLSHHDFTAPDAATDKWPQLVADLRATLDAAPLTPNEKEQRPAERAARRFGTGVEALIEAMEENAALRAAVSASEVCLRMVRNNLAPLRFWKEVHDQLHQIERNCCLKLGKLKKKLVEFETIEELMACRTNLRIAVGELRIIFGRSPELSGLCSWFDRLVVPACDGLERAVEHVSNAEFAQASAELDGVLEKLQRSLAQMPGLEAKIRTHAELLPATELRDALDAICDEWQRLDLDPPGLERFREAAGAIFYLCTGLLWMRADHTAWQQVDAEFRLSDPQLEVAMLRADTSNGLTAEEARIEAYAAYVDRSWDSAVSLFGPIVADPRNPAAAEISRQTAQVDAAIVGHRSVLAAIPPSNPALVKAARMLQVRYHDLRSRSGERFFLADCDLNEFAKNFAEIGAPIDAILSFLKRP